jgi:hypothetical protein
MRLGRPEHALTKLAALMVVATAACLTAATFAGATAQAKPVTFAAKLTAKAEVPPQSWKNPEASGSFTGEIRGGTVRWVLKFTGLTGPASAALHLGAAGRSGRVVLQLCASCYVPLTGTSILSKALLEDLASHTLYVNVTTKKNPNGEIRGQL